MSWRKLAPTEKQIKKLKEWGVKIPKTRGECSDLIGSPKFICKTCGKVVFGKIKKDIMTVKCCGISERYGKQKDWMTTRSDLQPDKYSTIGGGLIHSNYGVIVYVDDGNGQEWSIEDDYEDQNERY